VLGVKGLVKKPIEGAKESGREGFIKGVGKGVLGFVAGPTSGIADLTSTSLSSIKRFIQ
jgi:vacuolar protein sorting-associated protein 13A/C